LRKVIKKHNPGIKQDLTVTFTILDGKLGKLRHIWEYKFNRALKETGWKVVD